MGGDKVVVTFCLSNCYTQHIAAVNMEIIQNVDISNCEIGIYGSGKATDFRDFKRSANQKGVISPASTHKAAFLAATLPLHPSFAPL